jgi:hypothetical protein
MTAEESSEGSSAEGKPAEAEESFLAEAMAQVSY